jgi:hypothetical protein
MCLIIGVIVVLRVNAIVAESQDGTQGPRQSRNFAAMSEYFIDRAPACGVPNDD